MKSYIFAFFMATFLSACASSSTAAGVLGNDRAQLMLISDKQMDMQASAAYKSVLEQARKDGVLDSDKQLYDRVKNVLNRLISKVDVLRPDAKNWQWEVHIIDSDTINAWCMPGGRMVVYSGIVKKLGLSDDELAAIMGHEMAHALREHSREQASTEAIKGFGLVLLGRVLSLDSLSSGALSLASRYAISLPFSRQHESEADLVGVELMARGGYDPSAAVSLWKKMASLGAETPEFFSTHPSSKTRIKELERAAQKLKLALP